MGYRHRYEWDNGESAYAVSDSEVNEFIDLEDDEEVTKEMREAARERAEERAREQEGRMRAIAAVYEKADRIITLDPVTVKLLDDAQMPAAWNDGQNITMNTRMLRNYDDSDLLSLHGVNYHEVCHIMYSPRAGSDLGKWVLDKGYIAAFNALEDQRIETLFTSRYPSARVFLNAEALRYVIQTSDPSQIHFLIHGRRFVDYELRSEAFHIFAARFGYESAKAVGEIIDEYRTLAFPKDAARGKELIERFQLILWKNNLNPVTGCASREIAKKGRPEPSSSQQKDAEKDDKGYQQVDIEERRQSNESSDNGSKAEGLDSDSETQQASQRDKDEARKDDARLSDIANDLLDKLIDSPEAYKETKEFRRAVRANEFVACRIKKQEGVPDSPVDPKLRTAANRFGEVLRQIEEESDPTWEYEVPAGKLNTNRAMHADVNDLPRLFDRWYEGDDATVIEAAVLLDRSGSMYYRMDSASEAMWAIKRGLEKIDGRVTVYTFCEYSRLLYGADERASSSSYRSPMSGGNTNPIRALEETEMIMEASNRPTKIVFIVTDGMWDAEAECNKVIRRMNDAGVLTVLVHIGDLRWIEELAKGGDQQAIADLRRVSHNAQIVRSISNPADLVPLAERVVTAHLKSKIAR